MKYYSQVGQDKFLNEKYFKNKKDGIFIDVGAHDGITGNNSYFFEKELGWKGICIEPLPVIYKKLKQNRDSININCAVDVLDGETEFIENKGWTEMLSGILKYYDKRHFHRRDKEIKIRGGKTSIINVETLTLKTICDTHNIEKIDYLSIDVEGGELSVIQSIDFNKVFIDIIGFEDNYPDVSPIIIEYLQNNNYEFIQKHKFDIFMIHKNSIYNNGNN